MGPAPEASSSGGGIERRYPETSAMPVLARAADCAGPSALDAMAKALPGRTRAADDQNVARCPAKMVSGPRSSRSARFPC